MDIQDCTKHPFKIECPAELMQDSPDQWAFNFDNGAVVMCLDLGDGYWAVDSFNLVTRVWYHVEQPMTDDDSAITNLIDKIARLENP